MNQIRLLVMFGLLMATGCITRAGGALAPLALEPAAQAPQLEYTVGDFEFTLEGGKMVTSNKAGRILSDEIFKRWKKNGYISDFSYVPSSQFTDGSVYRMTLTGSQYGESSIAAQIFSGLTLMLIPYTVDTRYDVQYTLENAATGAKYSAAVADSYHTTIELLLFLAAPIARRGADQTWAAMGDHLYQQLRQQGAFADDSATEQTTPSDPM